MTDAALGALRPEQDALLRAHAAQCGVCGAALRSALALVAAVDGAAVALVAGEPSPPPAARPPPPIAEEPAAMSACRWPGVPAAAAALALAAALLIAVIIRRPSQQDAMTANLPAISVRSETARPETNAALSRAHLPTRVPPRHRSDVRSTEPEVLVPRGQLAAAFLLSEAAGRRSVDVVQPRVLTEQPIKQLEVKEIEIESLEAPSAKEPAVGAGQSDPAQN